MLAMFLYYDIIEWIISHGNFQSQVLVNKGNMMTGSLQLDFFLNYKMRALNRHLNEKLFSQQKATNPNYLE